MSQWIRWGVRVGAALCVGGMGLVFFVASVVSGRFQIMPAVLGALAVAGAWLSWPRRPNAWRSDPPTERQIAYAVSLGIDIPDNVSKGQLSDMISKVTGR